MAEKNDVPIIFFNRELVTEDLERWKKLYYVGADAIGSGIIRGELAAEAFWVMKNMTKTETVSASMWFWKEKPVIRMPSCAPNIL